MSLTPPYKLENASQSTTACINFRRFFRFHPNAVLAFSTSFAAALIESTQSSNTASTSPTLSLVSHPAEICRRLAARRSFRTARSST